MGLKRTILRFSEAFAEQHQSAINEDFKNNLKKIIGEFDIELYPPMADLARSYQRRIESLYKAFLLIMEVIPMRADMDRKGIMACRQYAHQSVSFKDCIEIEDYQKKLVNYTADLINTIIANYLWPAHRSLNRHQTAVALLNTADLYVIMQEGRANLATLLQIDAEEDVASSSTAKQSHWLLLHDRQHFPFCELTMEEFVRIKAMETPFITPSWFRELTPHLQSYFYKAAHLTTNIGFLKIHLNSLLLEWKKLLETRRYIIQGDLQLIAIDDDLTRLPDWFRCLSLEQQQMVKRMVHSKITLAEFEGRLKELSSSLTLIAKDHSSSFVAHLPHLRSLPYWYLLLSDDEQRLLNFSLRKTDNLYDAVSFLSSRLRTLPGLSNLAEHSTMFLDEQGNIIKPHYIRVRSSHICSRAVLDLPPEIIRLHAERNLEHILRFGDNKPALIQTLISPDRITYNVLGMPDYPLYYELAQVIQSVQHRRQIFYPNHPYNIARMVYLTYGSNPQCNALLEHAERFYSEAYDHVNTDKSRGLLSEEELNDLQFLINEYRSVLNSEMGSATWKEAWNKRGRELHLSALEHLLTFIFKGLAYSSCVSGKDRNWINIAYTDAMLIYREIYGSWFGFKDEAMKRTQFMTIFGQLIISRHGDEHAGQNAPGAEGIKHPVDYMPGDGPGIIHHLLNLLPGARCPLEIADKLASNNDVDEIINSAQQINIEMPKFEIAAQKLSEESRKQFLDQLQETLGDEEFWLRQRKNRYPLQDRIITPRAPQGIETLKNIFKARLSMNSMTLLARIYQGVDTRPEKESLRSEATQKLYGAILYLLKAEKPEDVLSEVLERIQSIVPQEASCSMQHY